MVASVSDDRTSSRYAVLALSLALLGAAAMLYYHLRLFMPRVLEVVATRNLAGGYTFGNDFYPVWLTSREWLREGRDPIALHRVDRHELDPAREIPTGHHGDDAGRASGPIKAHPQQARVRVRTAHDH